MSTWTEDRTVEFQEMLTEWGVTLFRNSLSAQCIKTPDVIRKALYETGYVREARCTVDMLKTEWTRLGFGDRAQFQVSGISYQVDVVKPDGTEPTVQFDAVRAI